MGPKSRFSWKYFIFRLVKKIENFWKKKLFGIRKVVFLQSPETSKNILEDENSTPNFGLWDFWNYVKYSGYFDTFWTIFMIFDMLGVMVGYKKLDIFFWKARFEIRFSRSVQKWHPFDHIMTIEKVDLESGFYFHDFVKEKSCTTSKLFKFYRSETQEYEV